MWGVALVLFFGLLALSSAVPLMAADDIVHRSVDATKPRSKIERNLFGKFAENLGHGPCEGIRVGADSLMPAGSIDGSCPKVITAVKPLYFGVLRFAGGNFVSAYEWRFGDIDMRPFSVNIASCSVE